MQVITVSPSKKIKKSNNLIKSNLRDYYYYYYYDMIIPNFLQPS